ncbi:hypothetical protein K402DRAFT_450743 [Aulographum hederae CBS 113979]|uniref:MICOS complex subunit MIC12 n=1 Tax=Aulographum hederae CBS 113979 TaxID=1176131 RepID=A0A6G1HDK1_9PEZI|nr:hypothetical protein K402DRAFT_450743 [Aulographum hederae CBS 113979]
MGFTSGLIGGFTVTASLLYLSVAIHQQNRLRQSASLRQQALVLTNIVEPLPVAPPPTSREARTSIVEQAKDRWNADVERTVRWVASVDWNDRAAEGFKNIVALGKRGFDKAKDEVPKPSGS